MKAFGCELVTVTQTKGFGYELVSPIPSFFTAPCFPERRKSDLPTLIAAKKMIDARTYLCRIVVFGIILDIG
jgi:hypothetical protein